MTNQEKRARQKERRAAIVAAQRAAAQRQRIIRGTFAVVALGAIIGLAIFAGGNGPGDDGTEAAARPAACGAEAPPEADPQQYDSPPEMALEDGVDYGATIETSCGTIEVDLLEEEAPATVNNFVFLAKEGYYDGLTFHRVEPDQVIQSGAPQPTGEGGPGYSIEDDGLPQSSKEYVFGTLAMANRGPDTAGSQFFFNVKDPDPKGGFESSSYPPDYALFGKVDPEDEESVETLVEISTQETEQAPDPTGAPSTMPQVPIYIESVEISEV